MYFVGLDLAWSSTNQTGIAVLDADGDLIDLGVGVDDDGIVAAVQPYVRDECVVAMDAPLIVKNATGRRRADAELSADFNAFDAGAYPANTGLAAFANGSRAARLAARLRLDMDPGSSSPRRAIEIYPHPASVVLFRLGRIVKYKRGEMLMRRAELLRLMSLIERLRDAMPPLRLSNSRYWAELRNSVGAATRLSQLDKAEDPVDAVLCAYLALFAHYRPHDVTTYGDVETGYIVTPALPPDLKPMPRVFGEREPTAGGRRPLKR